MKVYNSLIILLMCITLLCGCSKKSHFKRKIAGSYTGTCVKRTEENGIIKDTTYTATVAVTWLGDEPQGKNIFTIQSGDIAAYAWFEYDPGRDGDKVYSGGGYHAGYYQRTPAVTASFRPKEDLLICTVESNIYGGGTTTWNFTGKK